jgi:hypothetical protein
MAVVFEATGAIHGITRIHKTESKVTCWQLDKRGCNVQLSHYQLYYGPRLNDGLHKTMPNKIPSLNTNSDQ